MKISNISLRNFRRLQDVDFALEPDTTLFVGPNNSGKTSATAAFRLFFKKSDFSISDFNVACIRTLDEFGNATNDQADTDIPKIQLDIWVAIDPNKIEFGRAFSLIPNLSFEVDKVGIRLSFEASDPENMRAEYKKTFPNGANKPLSYYLGISKNLARHFSVQYYALQHESEKVVASQIDPDEGRRVLNGLIRLDFIDAQRNIHDEDTGRHNRLSAAFAAYYKHNLEKPAENEAATKVIDANNDSLTDHYQQHFAKLLENVGRLGVPSAHDRTLKIVSSLSPQQALQGNTELYYEDSSLNHRLPESYNGLGFKNLVYMAIQVSHFHAQWIATENNRPLCQIIFIEEPEVHLHAQVQQVFIENIFKIIKDTATDIGESYIAPQLVISTHSSHIAHTIRFEKIRYFCRCPLKLDDGDPDAPLISSKVLNLQDFRAEPDPEPEQSLSHLTDEGRMIEAVARAERLNLSRSSNLEFLKKYMKLTHCDLFFADAAVLVEGTVEKLLLPQMIHKTAPSLENRYLSVLEVGGAFAHKFASLMKFLGMPYVVITDIDTVDASNAKKACPASTSGSKTSNATLKYYFGVSCRDKLVALTSLDNIKNDGCCYVAFQRPTDVELDGAVTQLHSRTLEEAFVYENADLFRTKKICSDYGFAQNLSNFSQETYEKIRSENFKKTEFALEVLASSDWATPKYIDDGLKWLAGRLAPSQSKKKPIIKSLEAAE